MTIWRRSAGTRGLLLAAAISGLALLAGCRSSTGVAVSVPAQRRGGYVGVSVGERTTCAADVAGRISCWGCNDSGQRGGPSAGCRKNPRRVPLPGPAIQVEVGVDRACAVLSSGSVACWGSNLWQSLGDGLPHHGRCPRAAIGGDCSSRFVVVSGVGDAVEVALGTAHTCVRRRSGRIACWGLNTYGQLGDGSFTNRPIPARVSGLDDAVQVAAGAHFACALRRSGRIACWGLNTYGQLGDGRTHEACPVDRITGDARRVDCSPVPVAVALAGAGRIAAGSSGACAALFAGGVSCWGNFPGDDATRRPEPVGIAWARGAVDVSVGEWHACALVPPGGLVCWGRPDWLGEARTSHRGCPARYDRCAVGDPLPQAAGRVVQVAAGHSRSCVLHASGGVTCWTAGPRRRWKHMPGPGR